MSYFEKHFIFQLQINAGKKRRIYLDELVVVPLSKYNQSDIRLLDCTINQNSRFTFLIRETLRLKKYL